MQSAEAAPAPVMGKGMLILSCLVLAFTNFMVVLDTTIANVSVAHIAGGLGISSSEGTWVITSYAVAEAICVPLTGWLTKRFGTVRVFALGMAGFGIFSLLCGMSWSLGSLVAFRIGQGLCGGPLMPISQTLLLSIFPKEKHAQATGDYLVAQIDAGAEAVQIFDSWAGIWPEAQLRRWCLAPAAALVARIRRERPGVPVIVFPRGAGVQYQAYAETCGADALGLDTTVPLAWAREVLQPKACLQGNLDPLALVAGGEGLWRATEDILEQLAGGPFVFNLGHGIVPETPPEHVAMLVDQVRGWPERAGAVR